MVVGGDVLGFERKICGCEKKTKRLQPYCFLNALRTQTACGHPVMVLFKSNKYAFIHPYLMYSISGRVDSDCSRS